MITNHIIMPIGIIKKSTGAGTTIRLIPPHPSADKLQPQINILTRDSETGAHARAAVRVVEVQGNVAHLEILELETEPAWPEGRDPLVLQRRVMRKHTWGFFSSYGPFIMGDSHSFVASFKMRARVML